MKMMLPELPNGGRYTGYWRVSTDDQNPQMQIDALIAAGVPEERIRGDKMTGSTMKRPGLKSAMNITRDADVLVVWKLDRLGRSLIGVLDTIKTLDEGKIGLISLTDAVDTTSIMGRAMIQITLVFAEMERSLIAERTKAGMARHKAAGGTTGPPHRIRDCPKRLKAIEDLMIAKKYVPGKPDLGMTDGQVVRYLNAVEGSKLLPMKSQNSLSNWRKKDFEGWSQPTDTPLEDTDDE